MVVTVIMPVLNGMPYLSEALASLEKQSFREFEVLLWDNGSTDGSVEEARRWIPSKLDGRVVADNPLPFHQCLAAMVEKAGTEFVARMDSDDVCLPRRFGWQVERLALNPELGIVGGQCPMIDVDGKPLGVSHPGPLEHEDIVTEMMFRSALTHPALMFRRGAVLRAGNYARPKPVEDLDLYLRMVGCCQFENLDDAVLNYRVHPKSICQSDLQGQQRDMVEVVAGHAARVYGLEADTYRRLRRRGSVCAVIPMFRSAFFRSGRDLRKAWRIASSDSFLFISRCFTRPSDLVSKVVFRSIEGARRFMRR
jgi:glycosyltransferase involved in cell wall biosynthesis